MPEEEKNEGTTAKTGDTEEVTQDAQSSSDQAESTPAPAEPEPAAEESTTEDKKEEDKSEDSEESRTPSEKPKKKEKEPERQDVTTLHERTIATLSYFGFLAIVPFYLKKDSEFCRFHGKQGMLLAVIFFMAKLFTVIDLVMDIVLILQVIILFRMGFAALSGRWKKMAFFYDWSVQLEEALSLKSKDEELEEVSLKPNDVKADSKKQESK